MLMNCRYKPAIAEAMAEPHRPFDKVKLVHRILFKSTQFLHTLQVGCPHLPSWPKTCIDSGLSHSGRHEPRPDLSFQNDFQETDEAHNDAAAFELPMPRRDLTIIKGVNYGWRGKWRRYDALHKLW